MSYFVSCIHPYIKVGRYEIVNDPVNVSRALQIRKAQEKWYPDNTGLPAIEFDFGDDDKRWVFPDEKSRDAQYDKLLIAK